MTTDVKEKKQPVAVKTTITYKCDCCGADFESRRVRSGDKLCLDCIELRRALKGFIGRGLSPEEVIKRSHDLLGVKASKTKAATGS